MAVDVTDVEVEDDDGAEVLFAACIRLLNQAGISEFGGMEDGV